jgi:putative inorganic carbon (hco3(-)) transporter
VKVKVKIERGLERIVEIAIYGLVFIIPFSKAGIEIFGITAIVGWILLGVLRRTFPSTLLGTGGAPRNDRRLALTVFLAVNIISCITSVAIGHSISAFFTKTLEYALFFIIVVDVFSDAKRMKTLLFVMLVSVTLCYINGMVQYFTGFDIVRRDELFSGRISGSLINANDFGSYVIMFMPLLLSMAIWKKLILRYRVIIISVFLMSLFCLIFSYSRGSWLGFLVGILFFGFVKSKKLFLCFIVILIAGSFFLPERAKTRIKEIDSLEQVTANHRITLWKEALSIIEDWPVLGTGLNTYTMVAPHYKIHPQGGIYPHNSYLHMAAEIGLVGLGAFLWFIWTVFYRGFGLAVRRAHGTSSDISSSVASLMTGSTLTPVLLLGLMAGILGFLVNAFFDTTLFALRLIALLWVMMGVLVALCNIAENRSNFIP